ncbi:MAG: 4Fe-4S binding protein [Anaerolineales bacterium]|nr:4Fe-4S binding protein [Anaerolineales bacterium]
MPKKTIAVDYQACDPEQCENGICKAALVCERKVLTQEAPYEMPDAKADMCLGCSLCLQACPKGALKML